MSDDSLVEIKVSGLDAIHEQLLQLQAETAAKVLARAARKAFMPVLWTALGLVPVDSGALRDALKVSVAKSNEGDMIVSVGITVGRQKGGNPDELPPARRWHFIELGTARVPASPYLRPALDMNAAGVVDLLKEELVKGIERAVQRASRGRR